MKKVVTSYSLHWTNALFNLLMLVTVCNGQESFSRCPESYLEDVDCQCEMSSESDESPLISRVECTNTRDEHVSHILSRFQSSTSIKFYKSIVIQGSSERPNPMQVLANGSFSNLRVHELSILFTQLRELEEGSFAPHLVDTLQKLIITRGDLQGNNGWIELARLRRLQLLSLSHNKLDSVPSYAFSVKQENLKYINLKGNKIRSIGSHAFSGLRNLKVLEISENNLAVLGDYILGDELPRRKIKIAMDQNQLTIDSFSNNTFSEANNISLLSLNNNPLSDVVHQLKPILLGGGTLHMSNVPLECTCHSFWLLSDARFRHRCFECQCNGSDWLVALRAKKQILLC